jgi:two-component system, chemotaxis family, response regulator Rcp1
MSRLPDFLHVDDSDDDRALFARAFAASGMRAALHSLADVAQLLLYLNQLGPFIRASRPRLIVLDLAMPHCDGHAILDLLKHNARFRSIPVVVLTGRQGYDTAERCRLQQADEYFIKPATQLELVELIRSFDRWLVGSSTNLPATPSST